MWRHLVVLLFLYGVNYASGSAQETTGDVAKNRIKKDVGANGVEPRKEIFENFRNPVLEYLMRGKSDGVRSRGVVREIRHTQTLLVPNFVNLSGGFMNALPQFQIGKKPETETRNPPIANFWNIVNNQTEDGNETRGSVVTSQVVHLNKNPKEEKERTTVQVYPALAVVVQTFDKDGALKNSVTHFQPDFHSVIWGSNGREATPEGSAHNTVTNFVNGQKPDSDFRNSYKQQQLGASIPWPFAGVFPIVINDPFLSVYNAFSTSMYNAVSSMVEYGPDADICRQKETRKEMESEKYVEKEMTDSNVFDEVTMRSESFKRVKTVPSLRDKLIFTDATAPGRRRRDATAIYLKTRQGDKVSISLEEPVNQNHRKPEESDLILRKGGIAIAGPGGAATAYTGGTAIVGPYGTVYKSPEGMAILGPFSKIVNITDDMSFEEILKMHKELQNQEPKIRTGPRQSSNFKNFRKFFSYKTNLPLKINVKPQGRNIFQNTGNVYRLREDEVMKAVERVREEEFKRIVQDTPFEEKVAKENETTLVFRPKSKAEAGRNGMALSAPTSHAVLYPGQKTNIFFEPESVASAGPSGFAHAYSDLYLTYVPNRTVSIKPQQRTNKSLLLHLNDKTSLTNTVDERARSFNPVLVNTPPLSTILKPPNSESRQFLGYADKRRKTKPSKPVKEEGSSEEVGEEHEEESTSQSPESANEAVAISPPPEGASVAEAKPIGLAIAGPGGVAASKPQGTAVAGPGGLAIARPVGTAIAGVDVEGSVPIGGQQKNKKKPKQEQTEAELHYVGGLTGPIGNPQPKEFADGVTSKYTRDAEGNIIQESLLFRSRQSPQGYQLKLGQQEGKYGFVPMFASPVQSSDRLQKRMDNPMFFHGMLGNNNPQLNDQYQNYQIPF